MHKPTLPESPLQTQAASTGSLMDRFIEAVAEMRAAQIRFYLTRSTHYAAEHQQALRDSKRLEKEVDAMLRQMRPPTPDLFSQE